MNEPIEILTQNYVTGDCTIATTNDPYSSKAYLYDQIPSTQFIGTAGTDVITVTFKNWQGSDLSISFDRIILLNTNFKDITADYWNGSEWISIPEATATIASGTTNKIIEIVTAITCTKMRVTVTDTNPTAQQRKLGELKVCKSIVSPAALTTFARVDDQKAGAYRLAGGPIVAWREYTKVGGTLSLENVTNADLVLLLPYLKSATLITVIFYATFDVSEIYEFVIVNSPNYTIDRKAERYSINMELKER